jgi:hypothetical protein
MSEPDGLNPAERELEAALKSLAPAATHIDPIAAAFEAGQRSCRRQMRVWQAAAAALLLAGTGLWFVPAGQQTGAAPSGASASSIAERVELIHPDSAPAKPLGDQSLMMLQAAVAARGLDALPEVQLPHTPQVFVGEAIPTPR